MYKQKYLKYQKKYKELTRQWAGHSNYHDCIINEHNIAYRRYDAYSPWIFYETDKYFFKLASKYISNSSAKLENEYDNTLIANSISDEVVTVYAFGHLNMMDKQINMEKTSFINESDVDHIKKLLLCIINNSELISNLATNESVPFMISENISNNYISLDTLDASNIDENEYCFKCFLTKKVSEILKKISSKGLCHNDMFLHNVYYDPKTRQIKLIDFGNSFIGDQAYAYDIDYNKFLDALKDLFKTNDMF